MRQTRLVVLVTLLVVVVFIWLPSSYCAKKSVTAAARREDVPYIQCQVCEKVASELYRQVQKKQDEISLKKISEYQIIEIAENVCNLKKVESDWILKIDIVEQGDRLELVEQDTEGLCNAECKTIELACREVMDYADTDIAENIFSSKPTLDALVNHLCKGLSDSCRKQPPPVPKNRTPGEAFAPKPSKDAEMEKILKSMQDIPGAPNMQMYSREDLMNMKNFGNEDGGDDDSDEDEDEDEDENARFPSNLGKVLRKKETAKADWKQKITKGIKSTGATLKKHANKVSNQVRQWWKGSPAKKSKSGKAEL